MKIKTYAERILFGQTLEEKLTEITEIEESRYQALHTLPKFPNRPKNLQLHQGKTTEKFPSIYQIETSDIARGRVLHFFANHELLALELMALMLLRFPDAPEQFRRNLVFTMKEEQEHMQLYIKQMNSFGVEFGDLSVNNFFWKSISSVSTLYEFTSHMALTFEQANLDFSLYYKTIFAKIGDDETTNILQKVYDDEIGHVKNGLEWFRKWKPPGMTDWDAYTSSLHFPITPERGKTSYFSVEARQKAGFDEHFIQNIQLFSHSKGKTPDVYVFNPSCELEISSENEGFQPPKLVRKLADDLQYIPLILAGKDDVVLTRMKPRPEFLKDVKQLFPLPEFVPYKKSYEQSSIQTRKLRELRPWGWSPFQKKLFSELIPHTADYFKQHPHSVWQKSYMPLFSKVTSLQLLSTHLSSFKDLECISEAELGVCISSKEDALKEIKRYESYGFTKCCAKLPVGSSGRNICLIDLNEPSFEQKLSWIENQLKQHSVLILEPWLNKCFDFSMQYRIDADGTLHQLGFARFNTDLRGQYIHSHVGAFDLGLSKEHIQFLRFQKNGVQRLSKVYETCTELIKQSAFANQYVGHFGIDAIVYNDLNGQLKIRPIVEINCRFTMGHIALKLSKKVAPHSYGIWKIYKKEEKEFTQFNEEMKAKYPLKFSKQGLLQSGYLATSDPKQSTYFLSYLHVKEANDWKNNV